MSVLLEEIKQYCPLTTQLRKWRLACGQVGRIPELHELERDVASHHSGNTTHTMYRVIADAAALFLVCAPRPNDLQDLVGRWKNSDTLLRWLELRLIEDVVDLILVIERHQINLVDAQPGVERITHPTRYRNIAWRRLQISAVVQMLTWSSRDMQSHLAHLVNNLDSRVVRREPDGGGSYPSVFHTSMTKHCPREPWMSEPFYPW